MFREKESLKKELWKSAEAALYTLYGETPDARILNRFYDEKMIFGDTDAIIVWDIVADIRLEAKHQRHLTNLTGTDSSCFVAYLVGASDINPLPLHYHCPNCGRIEFIENTRALPFDIAKKSCECGHNMRADGFDIPYEMHIGRTKAHLTVAPSVVNMAEKIIKARAHGIYPCISMTKTADSPHCTYVFGETHNGKYPGIVLVAFAEYDRARILTESTGVSFESVLMGASEHYLSDPRLVYEIVKGNTDGVVGFDFNNHPRAERLKEDLSIASPRNNYDLLHFFGAMHGTRTWVYNADAMVKEGVCHIADIPLFRDDVFLMLRDDAKINSGIAFNIADKISHGLHFNELKERECDLLKNSNLPTWFIPYADKVRYISSKAAVVGSFRIALALVWYKLVFPEKYVV